MAVRFFWIIFFLRCKSYVYKIIYIYACVCDCTFTKNIMYYSYITSAALILHSEKMKKKSITNRFLFHFPKEKLWCTKYIKDSSRWKKKCF